jgi:hypothetical protein
MKHSLRKKTCVAGDIDRVRFVFRAEFSIDGLQMPFDRRQAEVQVLGEALIAHARLQELQNL